MSTSNPMGLPPHSPEAERGVLGSLLRAAEDSDPAWEEAIGTALEKLGAGGEGEVGCQFYTRAHATIYRAMLALDGENRRPDQILLLTRLRDQHELEEIGGVTYLAQLPDACSTPLQIGGYLDEVLDKWRLRRSIQVALAHVDRAMGGTEAQEVIEHFEAQVIALGDRESADGPRVIRDMIPPAMEAIEKSTEQRRKGLATGLQYPWSYANKMLMGILPRQLTVFGGEASSGKTSLMLNIAEYLAMCGHKVGILSAESGGQELTIRLLCINARVSGKKVHSGYASESDLGALIRASGRLTPAPIVIDDRSDLTPQQIRLRSRRLVARHGCEIILLDHLHECYAPEARGDMKLEGKLLMAACRWVALELDIPMIVLAQLNREAQREMAKSRARRPMKSDLRESGYIEQMADNIGILHRDRNAEEGEKEPVETSEEDKQKADETWPINLEIVKQRNGPTGAIQLTFHRPTFRFTDRYADTGAVVAGGKAVAVNEEADLLAEAEELL